MNELIKMMEQEQANTDAVFDDAVARVDAILDGLHRDFRDNIINDLPYNFGVHLYTILGDNINSTRQTKIVPELFAAGGALHWVTDNSGNGDVETYLKAHYRDFGIHHKFTHASTGRKFGMSYYNNAKGRMYTTYLDQSNVFYYLRQEHVDMIKDDYKRKAAQDFIDLRDKIVDEMGTCNSTTVPVDIPVRAAVMYNVTKSALISGNGHYSGSKENIYTIIESYTDYTVRNIVFGLPVITKWDASRMASSQELRRNNKALNQEYVNLFAFGEPENSMNNGKRVTFFGNIELDYDQCTKSLHTKYKTPIYRADQLANTSNSVVNLSNYGEVTKKGNLAGHAASLPKGIVLDWDKIMSDPTVNREFRARLDMFKGYSKTLHDLKTEYADLYFLFAD